MDKEFREYAVPLGPLPPQRRWGRRRKPRTPESLRAVTIGFAPSTEAPPNPDLVERMHAISASIDRRRAQQERDL